MLLGQQGCIPDTHAFCVYVKAELKMNTAFVKNGQKEMSLQLEKRIFLMKVYCLLTKYYHPRFTLS